MEDIRIEENGQIEENDFSDYGSFFSDHFDIIETEDGDFYSMKQEDFDWWFDYHQKREEAQENLDKLLKSKPELQKDFNNDVFFAGVEFNDYPDAMIQFVDDNK